MKALHALFFLFPFSCFARHQQKPLLQPIPHLATILDTNDDVGILNLLFQHNATVLSHVSAAKDVTFLAPSDEAFRKLLEGHCESPRCEGGRRARLKKPSELD
jgi:hypothetical protein